MKDKNNFVGAVLFLLALLLTAGTAYLFPTCGPMENGSWMKCHWSGQTVIGSGVVLLVQSASYLVLKSHPIRAGISFSIVPTALLALAIPNEVIGVCSNVEMQCRAVTQPAVTILSIVIALVGTVNAFWLVRHPHKRS